MKVYNINALRGCHSFNICLFVGWEKKVRFPRRVAFGSTRSVCQAKEIV